MYILYAVGGAALILIVIAVTAVKKRKIAVFAAMILCLLLIAAGTALYAFNTDVRHRVNIYLMPEHYHEYVSEHETYYIPLPDKSCFAYSILRHI